MHSTKKVIFFVLSMTTIVSLTLALIFYLTQDVVKKNEEVYNKRATLSAIKSKLDKDLEDITDDEIISIFENQITQKVIDSKGVVMDTSAVKALGYGGSNAEAIDMKKEKKKAVEERSWPVYEYTSTNGEKYLILAVRGNGLWDEIWGYLALESDLKTVAGVAFDHKAETPGLGAEIKDNKAFQEQFIGTTLVNENGNYQGILVRKGGAQNKKYEVDGLTGATITADGVTAMLDIGINAYAPYLKATSNN